jgi:hypothetical protein
VVSVGLLVLALATTTLEIRRVFSVALLVGLVPLGVYLMASNNPSGTAVAGISSYWIALMAVLRGARGRRAGVAMACAIASAIVATMSRADAGVYVIVATAAALALESSPRPPYRRFAWLAVPCAFAVWVVLASQQSAGSVDGFGLPNQNETRPLGGVIFNNLINLPYLWAGALGAFPLGYIDVPMPSIVSFTMMSAFVAVSFAGLRSFDLRKGLALLILGLTLVLLPTYFLAIDRYFVGEMVQPRYLLPLFPLVAATAMRPSAGRGLSATLTPLQVGLVAVGAVVANAAALHSTIRRYVTGVDVFGFDLGAAKEWWWDIPVGPMALWGLGTVGFAVAVAAGLAILAGDGRDGVLPQQ